MPTVPGTFDADSAVKNYLTAPTEPLRAPGSMRESMAEAVKARPDEEAEARKIAQRTGVPITAIFENRDEIVRQHNFDSFDFDTYEKQFPASANLLSDTEFAKVAHDDIENMGLIETSLQKLGNAGRTLGAGAFSLMQGTFGTIEVGGAVANKYSYALSPEQRVLASFAQNFYGPARQSAKATAQDILAPAMENSGLIEGGIYSGFQSVASNLPGMVASVITKNPAFALASAGVVSGGTAAGEALDQNIDPLVALGYGLADATVEVGTELVPVTKFLGDLKAGSGFFKTVGHQIAAEVPGELIATTLQNFNEWVVLNSDQPFQTYLNQLPNDLAQTLVATLTAVGAQTGAITLGNAAVRRIQERERKAQDGEQSAQTVEQLTKLAQSSKLLQRDPDSFERFIEAANAENEVQDIYLDPKELAQSGIDVAKLAEISPSIKKQAQLATETGGLLKIPVSEYASTLAASEFGQPLLDHARTDPLGMSRSEAKEFMQSAKEEFEAEVEKSLEANNNNQAYLQSREVVHANILDQLETANRFTEDVNRQYASLLSNFYAVQATRLGITPEEMFERYPVGVQAQGVVGGFDQKIFHGTTANFNIADIKKSETGVYGPGIYFSADKEYASRYGMNVLETDIPDTMKLATNADWHAASDKLRKKNYSRVEKTDRIVDLLKKKGFKGVKDGPVINIFEPKTITKEIARAAKELNQPAYHGSPYHFDKFTTDRIGTGEGAQAYGWGLYFAGNKEIAEYYREYLSAHIHKKSDGTNFDYQMELKNPNVRATFSKSLDVDKAIERAEKLMQTIEPQFDGYKFAEQDLGVLKKLKEEGGISSNKGQLYEVSIPEDDVLLHWDKTLAEQPETVREALYASGYTSAADDMTGEQMYWDTRDSLLGGPDTENAAELASKLLNDFGIKGIKYLGNNTPGQSEHNYVIFDDSAIETLDTYYQGNDTRRGSFNPETSVISLFNAADLSTFLHEAGHFFLETLNTMALDPNAPAEITADMEATLKWLGVESLADWNAKDLEAQREYHEKFARGFEAYLFEGKAPNAEVAGIMGRFRDWLLMVYQNIRNLDVEISDDIRGVFDRLLATNESIAEAESLTGFTAMFASAEDAGMSPEEWAQYQKLGQEATEHARAELGARTVRDIKWLSNARSKKLKELQRDAETKRRAIRREVTEEVMNEPVNQARAFIRTGKTVDGTQTEGTHRLDIAALKDMYGEGDEALWRTLESKYGKYGMVGNDGLHPDAVAEQFGFSSGDELVQALVAAENPRDKIQGMTDQRMIERYGDISDPKSLELAADAAIHNDARARFVATEVNALNKATGKRKILTDAAKQYGALMIARLRVRDVKPARYKAAEAKAARAAEKAMRSGDVETAAIEKRSQLVQMHAAKAAIEALDEIDKAVKYFNKFNKDAVREKLAADYVEQIDALLERFDLRKGQSLKQIDKRTSLANWIEAQKEVGIEPDIPTEILDGANRKHYKDMTVEEMRGLVDTVKQIEHLGRLKEKLLTAADNRDFQRTVEDLRDSIYNNGKGRVVDNTTRATAGDRAMRLFKGYIAQHRKIASLARQMDGVKDGGPMWETFIRSMNEAGGNEAAMRADATEKLAVLVAPIMKQGKMGGSGVYFPSIGRSLNREERIAMALNTGNAGNLQRLLDGEKWTAEQIQPVLDTITPEEAKFVQSVWDLFESYRPQIAAKEKRIYGKEPEWVEPVPLILGGVELRGGYFPIKYDARRNATAERHNDAELAKQQMKGAYTSATTRRSFTKSRADEVLGRPLVLTMDGLYTGLNEVIHDLSWHEWLIDANRLMRSKKLDAAIRETYGAETVQQFKTAIQDIAAGEMPSGGAFERAVGNLRNGASVAGLGLNIVTAAINVTGIAQSCVRVGPKWVLQGVDAWASDPFGLVGKIYEKSDFMRLRGQTMNREINEIQNMLRDKTKTRAAIDRYSYLPLTMTQVAIDTPTWWGAYQKALAEGNDETRAVALADQAVLDSQGGGQVKDLAAIQRGGPIQKLFTTFYSYFSTTLQLTAEQTAKTNFEDPADVIRLGGDYLMLYTVPALFGTIIRGILGGDGDDWLEDPASLAQAYANEQISYAFGTLVGLREASGAVQKAFGVNQYDMAYGGPAGLRFLSELDKLGSQLGQGEIDRALFRSLINVGGIYLRLPSGQINRTIDGAASIIEGNSINPGSLITGGPRE